MPRQSLFLNSCSMSLTNKENNKGDKFSPCLTPSCTVHAVHILITGVREILRTLSAYYQIGQLLIFNTKWVKLLKVEIIETFENLIKYFISHSESCILDINIFVCLINPIFICIMFLFLFLIYRINVLLSLNIVCCLCTIDYHTKYYSPSDAYSRCCAANVASEMCFDSMFFIFHHIALDIFLN